MMFDFRVQLGCADDARTFVRVIHLPSGKERLVVGVGDENAQVVEQRSTRHTYLALHGVGTRSGTVVEEIKRELAKEASLF
jgi:hypothetical protein